jgi:ATP-dependent protease ClpP protease subunit
MKFDLKGTFTLSDDISKISKEIEKFIATTNETILKKVRKNLQQLSILRLMARSLFLLLLQREHFGLITHFYK